MVLAEERDDIRALCRLRRATQNRLSLMTIQLMKLESRVQRLRRFRQVYHVLQQYMHPRYRNESSSLVQEKTGLLLDR